MLSCSSEDCDYYYYHFSGNTLLSLRSCLARLDKAGARDWVSELRAGACCVQ